MDREFCAKPEAETIIQEALNTDTIGISNFLAKRYGITRANYFDVAWNINPEDVVKNFETQQQVIKQLSGLQKRLFLLTGAPRVWMENVLRFLGLESDFDRKFNGEMFADKTEVFESLSKEFNPGKILSIGDQFESDLKPAAELGMQILQVKSPEDLKRLL
jgi:FMN phosphatase YigB (HAD superfamily)